MRQSTMVGWSCLLFGVAFAVGTLLWAGAFYGAILLLLGGAFACTFAILVDLREREERQAQRWPSREG